MTVTVKISSDSNKEELEQCVHDQEKLYAFVVKSKVLPNSDGKGYHVFLNLNPTFKNVTATAKE
jgi:hypothetical protein